MASKSPQYDVVQKNFHRLSRKLTADIGNFAAKAFEKSLISQQQSMDAIERVAISEEGRSQKLLHQILYKIEDDPMNFDMFLTILEEIPVLNDIPEQLRLEKNQLESKRSQHQAIVLEGQTHEEIAAQVQEPTLEPVLNETSNSIETGPPVCQPGKPCAASITHDSIALVWAKPEFESDKVNFYIISCGIQGEKQFKKKPTHANDPSLVIAKLQPNTAYMFQVRPECIGNVCTMESEFSDPIKTQMWSPDIELQSKDCGDIIIGRSQPSKPDAISITCNSVQLSWKMLDMGSTELKDLEFFIVSFILESDHPSKKKWRKQSTIHAETMITVKQLRPATSYIFRISAVSKSGIILEGEESSPIRTTNTTKPGKPTAAKVTDATILITWTHPDVGQDTIKSYTIFYCLDTGSQLGRRWNSRQTENKTTELLMIPLKHNTKYLFKVRPESTHGVSECESDISDAIETNTTSEPLGVKIIKITHSTVQLKWNKPVRGQESIISYDVHYQKLSSSKGWKRENANATQTNLTISRLHSFEEYKFKVVPICDVGKGTESETIQVTTKQLICKPGQVTLVAKKHNSIHIKWNKPEYGKPEYYTCCYQRVQENQWEEIEQKPTTEEVVVKGLTPNTTYVFSVNPEFQNVGEVNTEKTISEWMWTVKVPDTVPECLKVKCTKISGGPISVYKIPIKKVWEAEQLNRIARYELDIEHPPLLYTAEKVLMLVGATGAGKSTLINGIMNYLYKVEYEDNFRFKMICDESDHGQTHSQTSSVNAYTIYPLPGSRINYTLTIIDTPGFGNTRGLQQDQELFGQIKDFFTHSTPDDKGIDQIHGVGFVVKNPEVRLTATQKYNSSSILSLFGKDIKDNIFLMVTFADGAKPPVLEAVKEAEFPFKEHFKFNNSALYPETKDSDPVSIAMWEMGQNSFQKFFQGFENYSPQSLTLTKETLEERERLDSYLKTLRDEITKGVQDIDKLQQLKEKLLAKEQNIDALKDFKITVNVTKQRKVDLRRGVYVTNCLKCNRTCHDNCGIPSDSQKYNCCVMDRRNGVTNATCTVCAGKCHWSEHVNNPYMFEFYTESQEQTFEYLKKHHDRAKLGKLTTEVLIKDLEEGLEDLRNHVMSLVENAQKSLERLAQIALKPNPPSSEGYIDLLIEEEKRDGRTGYEKRIAAYEQLKTKDIIRCKVMSGTASSLNRQDSGDTSADKPKKKKWYHSLFEMISGSD